MLIENPDFIHASAYATGRKDRAGSLLGTIVLDARIPLDRADPDYDAQKSPRLQADLDDFMLAQPAGTRLIVNVIKDA